MCNYLVNALVLASQNALKLAKSNEYSVVWSPELSQLKIESRIALQSWHDGSCPTIGILFDNKQHAKHLYKNALIEQKLSRNYARLQHEHSC